MSARLDLLRSKLVHLERMAGHLAYSHEEVKKQLPIADWAALSPAGHAALAAFRVRFSDLQEHLGKALRAVAREEEQETEPFTAVLLYAEKLGIIDSAQDWKELRELRNAINHEYEDDPQRLAALFVALAQATPRLLEWQRRLQAFCRRTYGLGEGEEPPCA
jgi:hypothetical protein